MAFATDDLDKIVTTLVPSLSRSLGDHFNVFRVMHHGTHEKQFSNVFAWLLDAQATHGLDDRFQQIFIDAVNAQRPDLAPLPTTGYRVSQEIDTSGRDEAGQDIADIVLSRHDVSIVVENYFTSDGHGHGYNRYLKYGMQGDRTSAVVLLCGKFEPHRRDDDWKNAATITYGEVLYRLNESLANDRSWGRAHPEQEFFITQFYNHFVEGVAAVSIEDRVAFIKSMCETGESARYGQHPHKRAAEEFAAEVAQHAERQFSDGRALLGNVKRSLKHFAESQLVDQFNSAAAAGKVVAVETPYQGLWEFCVALRREGDSPSVFLEFGPTAVAENQLVAEPLHIPDFGKIFVTRRDIVNGGIDRILETDVGLEEVLQGLADDDPRLSDAALSIVGASWR